MKNNEEAVLQAMLAEIQKNNQLMEAENKKQEEIRKNARICISVICICVGIAVMLNAWGQLQLMGGF